uniref:Uncharacterized protein n=1 Tax=Setaria digitata TaxID=48799 RepID=A0A915Q7C7_9BILA
MSIELDQSSHKGVCTRKVRSSSLYGNVFPTFPTLWQHATDDRCSSNPVTSNAGKVEAGSDVRREIDRGNASELRQIPVMLSVML